MSGETVDRSQDGWEPNSAWPEHEWYTEERPKEILSTRLKKRTLAFAIQQRPASSDLASCQLSWKTDTPATRKKNYHYKNKIIGDGLKTRLFSTARRAINGNWEGHANRLDGTSIRLNPRPFSFVNVQVPLRTWPKQTCHSAIELVGNGIGHVCHEPLYHSVATRWHKIDSTVQFSRLN